MWWYTYRFLQVTVRAQLDDLKASNVDTVRLKIRLEEEIKLLKERLLVFQLERNAVVSSLLKLVA